MSGRRWLQLLVIAVLLGVFGYRAYNGVRAGWNFDRGRLQRNLHEHLVAADYMDRAGIGPYELRAALAAAEARVEMWERVVRVVGPLGANPELLTKAGNGYLACRCYAPASRDAFLGLAEVYDGIEWTGRELRATTPYVEPENPWDRVGRPGRVAVGLFRAAIETSPGWGRLHGKLALRLLNYGVYDEAREAVRESARTLPIYARHPYREIPEMPAWVDREFADASREVLGQVPLFSRDSHLVELAKLERRIGNNAAAIPLLEEVLAAGGDPLRRAEASYHLGLALLDEQREDEGRAQLAAAMEHPVFRVPTLHSLASYDEQSERYDEALTHLRRIRWERPHDLPVCLWFARVARKAEDWPAALEALRWAKLNHPSDPQPYVALAEVHLAMDKTSEATLVVDELAQLVGADAPEVVRLRRAIDAHPAKARSRGRSRSR